MTRDGIILAAGSSSRTAPDCKLALILGGQTVLEKSIASMKPFCSQIYVITGAYRNLVESLIREQRNITPVYNPDHRSGMYGSVKAGLRSTAADQVWILPGDCPFVTADIYSLLLAAEGEIVVPVWHGQAGHPVLLKRSAVQDILRDTLHESLRQYISAHPHQQVEVFSCGILKDIDTKEDYRQSLIRMERADDGG